MFSKQPERSDTDLLTAIRRSGEERERAMAYLWKDQTLRNMAFAALFKLLRDKRDVEDAFADAIVRFMRNILDGKFRGESSLRTYIVGICINVGKKRAWQPPQYLSQEDPLPLETIEQKLHDTSDSAEKTFLEQEYEKNLERFFQKLYRLLPAHCERNLRLHHDEGYSVKEIAVMEQIQEQSAKTKLWECRKKLRELIEQDPDAIKIMDRRKWKNWKK